MITIPPASALQPVFDIKGVLEPAISNVFSQAGFVAAQIIDSTVPPNFQADTPRVEVKVTVGESTEGGAFQLAAARVYCTFKAQLVLRAITKTDAAGKSTHAAYRPQIYFIGSLLGYLINNQQGALVNHRIYQPVKFTGSSDVYSSAANGIEWSDQNFTLDVSIVPSPALIASLVPFTIIQPSP